MKKGVGRSLSAVANIKQEHWRSAYHRDYYADGRAGLGGKASAEHRRAALEAVVPLAHDRTLLDLGCAEGLMLPPFLENGARSIHGVDRSAKRIASARALVKNNRVRFDMAELNDPSCLDDEEKFEPSYDIVLCLGVYQHLDEEVRRLVLYKALQKTGRYFVFRAPKAEACEAFPVIERAGFGLETIVKSPGVKKLYIYRRCKAGEEPSLPMEQLLGPAEEFSSPPEAPEIFVEGPAPEDGTPSGAMLYGLQRLGTGAAVATIALVAGLAVVRIGIPDHDGAFLTSQAQAEGYWNMHVVDSSANGADSLDVADLDGDGDQDLVAGWQQSGLVRLYENLGRSDGRQIWKTVDIAGGLAYMGLEDVSFADFDRDGRRESILTAVGVPGMQLSLHSLQQREPPFEAESWVTDRLTGFFSGDYNEIVGLAGERNGISEVFAGHAGGLLKAAVSWRTGSSVRQEYSWSQPVPGGAIREIGLHDVNDDGQRDLLFTQQGHLGWLENPEAESKGSWAFRGLDRRVTSFSFCDVDDDGRGGVLAVAEASRKSSGTVGQYHEYGMERARGLWPIAAAGGRKGLDLSSVRGALLCRDLNGRGFGEIVTIRNEEAQALSLGQYQSQGSEGWSQTAIAPRLEDGNYSELRAVDMDADGDRDILAAEEGANLLQRGLGVVWFENPGVS